MVGDIRAEHESEWAAIGRGADLLGIGTPETVRKWCRHAEVDAGNWPEVTTEDSPELKRLKRETAELKRPGTPLDSVRAGPSLRAHPVCGIRPDSPAGSIFRLPLLEESDSSGRAVGAEAFNRIYSLTQGHSFLLRG